MPQQTAESDFSLDCIVKHTIYHLKLFGYIAEVICIEPHEALLHLEGVALTIPVKSGTMNPKLKALGLAVDALQKQIPAPLQAADGLRCPACGYPLTGGVHIRYCASCGQALGRDEPTG